MLDKKLVYVNGSWLMCSYSFLVISKTGGVAMPVRRKRHKVLLRWPVIIWKEIYSFRVPSIPHFVTVPRETPNTSSCFRRYVVPGIYTREKPVKPRMRKRDKMPSSWMMYGQRCWGELIYSSYTLLHPIVTLPITYTEPLWRMPSSRICQTGKRM